MQSLFLSNDEKDKKEYRKIIEQTAEAVCDAFDSSSAYSGPEPEELRKDIHLDSILPDNGLGWELVLELTKQKILPNMLRTPSTDYMPHIHGPHYFCLQPVYGFLGSGAGCNGN